jgi:ABC-type uncharacterized transport system substrate-binding protein
MENTILLNNFILEFIKRLWLEIKYQLGYYDPDYYRDIDIDVYL